MQGPLPTREILEDTPMRLITVGKTRIPNSCCLLFLALFGNGCQTQSVHPATLANEWGAIEGAYFDNMAVIATRMQPEHAHEIQVFCRLNKARTEKERCLLAIYLDEVPSHVQTQAGEAPSVCPDDGVAGVRTENAAGYAEARVAYARIQKELDDTTLRACRQFWVRAVVSPEGGKARAKYNQQMNQLVNRIELLKKRRSCCGPN